MRQIFRFSTPKNFYISAFLLLFAVNAAATSFDYSNQWERISTLESKNLPQSALQSVDSLMQIAAKEQNSAQFLKGWIYRFRFLMQKDQDSFFPELKKMEEYTAQQPNGVEKSVLHSLLAKLYEQYYSNKRYTINNRTLLAGFVPDDIKEWTINIFADTIAFHVKASLENVRQLQATPATEYEVVMTTGEDNRLLQPTLFDFLCARGIEMLTVFSSNAKIDNRRITDLSLFDKTSLFIQQIDTSNSFRTNTINLYRQWLAFRLHEDNKAALIHTDLQRLEYIHRYMQNPQKNEKYLAALDELRQANFRDESVVEVLATMANYYLQHDEYNAKESEKTNRFRDYKKRAYDLCEEGIRQFPNYKRINLLKLIRQEITSKTIKVANQNILSSSTPVSIAISAENTPQLELRVYSIPSTTVNYLKNRPLLAKNAISKGAKLISTQTIHVEPSLYFRQVDTTFILPSLPYGIYEYAVSDAQEVAKPNLQVCGQIYVSDLASLSRTIAKDKSALYVVNRVSGHPQKDVVATVFSQNGYGENLRLTKIGDYKTDENGHLVFPTSDNRPLLIQLTQGNDVASPCKYISTRFYDSNSPENDESSLSLFTDRAIYRPGQTVYFKGIAWLATKDTSQVMPWKEYTITLRDANFQEVSKQSVKTNDFGSFSGSFTLPKGQLNGRFSIQAGGKGTTSFLVEEYKRPTFEIIFDTIKGTPAFGDKVTLSGNVRSYADFPIENALVKYRIVRRPHWLMRWPNRQESEIQNGQIKSDEKGRFEVSFIPQKQDNILTGYPQYYSYTLMADVTDSNGETQTNETSFAIGDHSMYLTAEVQSIVNKKDSFDIQINALNLNNIPVKTVIFYTISRLKPATEFAEKIQKENLTAIDKQMLSGTIETSKETKLPMPDISKWESGKYLIQLLAKDEQGRNVELMQTFIIYSTEDKRPPVKRYCWIQEINTTCKPGESADILFGTSASNVKVLYELLDGNRIVESKWMDFDDEMKHLQILYKKEWNSAVSLQLTFIKDEQIFSQNIIIKRAVEGKNLQPLFSVFRDRLLPGQKEEWKIIIPELNKTGKQAEAMVTMFDASLDAFIAHSWEFKPVHQQLNRWWALNWSVNLAPTYRNRTDYPDNEIFEPNDFFTNQFIDVISQLFRTHLIHLQVRGSLSYSGQNRYSAPVVMIGAAPMEDTVQMREVVPITKKTVEDQASSADPNLPLRTNFAETAFFYPQLRTNEKGEVAFSFTAPESLTRWNVMGLAHTKDLYFGQWSAQTVTQKPFMVQPNLPRFVRESDRLIVTAKLINLSDKPQAGKAHLELIDPETDKSLPVNDANPSFSVEKDGTATVNWTLSGFSGKQMLICKITASTEEFSDGEQRYLPVLPDKIRVTETLPIRVQGNQTKQFLFNRLLSEGENVDNKNLTVEFSANPAWYAVQALPALSIPNNDCSVCWFSVYYANTLAASIVRSNPKITTIYQQWQESGNALRSNLEKNEELKNILLTETPWVLEAKNETEQKQRISELFDVNRQSDNRRQAMEKLASLQIGNGAFAWFKGMPDDRFLTQYILEGMARLRQMGADSYAGNEKEMIRKAIAYSDEQLARDFSDLKRNNKEWEKLESLTASQIYYFYMRSSYKDIPVAENAAEAASFYQKRLYSSWTECSLFGQALIAITAQRNGDTKLSTEIAKSLLENASLSDEKGMYWANNRGGIWWHESNIATQTAIIEALTAIKNDPQQIDNMKLWLLSQKQTERWNSPIATADAIYALLMNGKDWLSGSNDISLTLGNIPVKRDKNEAGTGYSKTTFESSAIHPEMGKIIVENRESHPAWGAIYWQYETTLNKITPQKGIQLNVDKKLYIEHSSSTGQTLEPIGATTPLQVGNKVTVRLTVSADRDMEYVVLTNQRAACLEPTEQLSGFRWNERVGYYQSTKDASTQFFFSYLPKGTYVFEYSAWITRAGTYNNGIATLQCQYAPEFAAHSGSEKITIK